MNATIQGLQVPAGATVHVKVEVTAPVNITPFVAMQNANVFAKMNISTQCGAGDPNLRVGDRVCWVVPINLSFPSRGPVGCVGELLVDATTGEVLAETDTVERMNANALRLAQRASLPAGV